MSMTEVYKVHPENVGQVIKVLGRKGISAQRMDDSEPVLQYAAHGTYLIRVAVPTEQVGQAREILKEWEKSQKTAMTPQTHLLRDQFLLSTLIAVIIWLIIFLIFDFSMNTLAFLPFLLLICFVIISNKGRVVASDQKKTEKPKRVFRRRRR